MKKRLTVIVGSAFVALLFPMFASAQSQPSVNDVVAKFAGWTEQTATAAGYEKDIFCIDGSVAGMPQIGGMGYHAINATRITPSVDPLNPGVVVIDPRGGKVVAVEYLVPDTGQARPSVFNVPFEGPEAHGPEGPAFYSLHLWILPNPAGQFAAFNPNIACSPGTTPPIPGLPATGDSPLPWLPIGLSGGAFLLAGMLLVRLNTPSRRRGELNISG